MVCRFELWVEAKGWAGKGQSTLYEEVQGCAFWALAATVSASPWISFGALK